MQNFKGIIIAELETVSKKEAIEKQHFKVRAYQKVIKQIKTKECVSNMEDLVDVQGMGKQIKAKIEEIFQTGKLRAADKARANNNLELYDDLLKIHGIGVVKAKELVDYGISSIEELIEKQEELLNDVQKIGLKYFKEIDQRIPREEMEIHDNFLKVQIAKLRLGIKFEIVGSYRRKLNNSGDIDILICPKKEISNSDRSIILSKIIKHLTKINYIEAELANGNKKFMGVCRLNTNSIARRIDMLITSIEDYPYALLYFTGSQANNIKMRQVAIEKGYSLNEYNMTKIDDEEEKVILKSEKEIFKFLNMKYLKPEKR
jgi:DNA polymerase beta